MYWFVTHYNYTSDKQCVVHKRKCKHERGESILLISGAMEGRISDHRVR